jgi:hypothetical protein
LLLWLIKFCFKSSTNSSPILCNLISKSELYCFYFVLIFPTFNDIPGFFNLLTFCYSHKRKRMFHC